MKKRNLSAKKRIHNFFLNKLKNPKIKKIYSEFKKNLEYHNPKKLCLALSGGPDSVALAFLAKCYSIQKKTNYFYYIVDHKLRIESTFEAKLTKKKLEKFGINCEILTWRNKKAFSNIQSKARDKRYELIFKECLKKKINLVITAHQKNDLFENFFIRLLRGSGLKGLSSFNKIKAKISKEKNIYILRPLLNIAKKDLIYIANKTFNFYIKDPSNNNDYFLRVKIRKLIKQLNQEGLSLKKLKLTLENLHQSNLTIEFYVKKNIEKNSKVLNEKKSIIVNENFFNQPEEIVFRSLSELMHKLGNKKKYTRGNKVLNLMKNINSSNIFKKMTLSGCIFEKVNKSIIISRES
jgi:tRNA(Ile)-lysidine synthase